jgi:hypothetical protein
MGFGEQWSSYRKLFLTLLLLSDAKTDCAGLAGATAPHSINGRQFNILSNKLSNRK